MINFGKHIKWLRCFALLLIASCAGRKDYYTVPTFSATHLNAVIEIPAGTNKKIEYDHNTRNFLPDQRQGKDRYIAFLGYPGSYGFIPSTYSDPARGGDGDALDILILGASMSTGSVQQVIPLGVLKLVDDGELDYKVIAIPTDQRLQHIYAANWEAFNKNYPAAREIIGLWFTNYDSQNETTIQSWGDEKEALAEIKKWQIKSRQ
ncbi:inorganic diphosphatase [Flavimarina sp. Hel_I_48]|uniref:inorganic diphosphatase n=1 Tax=Flavimarina sp. Hel_I_48 TaxID=1392488 RepID=UPI00068EC0FC|nr:inorganic diphosphatase [Flavimarina sp. Hel_I_48]